MYEVNDYLRDKRILASRHEFHDMLADLNGQVHKL